MALTDATRTQSKEPRHEDHTDRHYPRRRHHDGGHPGLRPLRRQPRGKNYRTAQSKKPVASKEVAAKPAVPGVTAIAPANVVGQSGVVAPTVQSAVDGSGATF